MFTRVVRPVGLEWGLGNHLGVSGAGGGQCNEHRLGERNHQSISSAGVGADVGSAVGGTGGAGGRAVPGAQA